MLKEVVVMTRRSSAYALGFALRLVTPPSESRAYLSLPGELLYGPLRRGPFIERSTLYTPVCTGIRLAHVVAEMTLHGFVLIVLACPSCPHPHKRLSTVASFLIRRPLEPDGACR